MIEDRGFFGHPIGLRTLFLIELWERFSYYGMRALLMLFMTASVAKGGLGFGVPEAGAIYGLYTGMVYLLALPGGWIADKILGARRSVLYGGIVIALGHYCLAFPSTTTFFLGLVLIVIGTGLLKPNVSTMVGQLYAQHDARRDAGFSIFYMGINLGAFIAPLICSYLGENINWHYGFGVAGLGMTLGVAGFAMSAKSLVGVGLPPKTSPGEMKRFQIGGVVFVVLMAVCGWLAVTGILSIQSLSSGFGLLLTLIVVALFGGMIFLGKWSRQERGRLIAIFILFTAAALFWSIYEQAGSTLNLFAERNTDRSMPGTSQLFPAGWFQSAPALFVIALAPVFAWLWVSLGKRNPGSFLKFSVALVLGGVSLIILLPVAARTGVSPFWLLMTYLLQTLGELCLSPVGLSAMTKLAPTRVAGLIMGIWFVAISVGDYISGRLASIYDSMPLPHLFGYVGLLALVLGIILAALVKPMKQLTGGAE